MKLDLMKTPHMEEVVEHHMGDQLEITEYCQEITDLEEVTVNRTEDLLATMHLLATMRTTLKMSETELTTMAVQGVHITRADFSQSGRGNGEPYLTSQSK